MQYVKTAIFFAILLFLFKNVTGQELPQAGIFEEYYRVLQVSGVIGEDASFLLRPVTPVYNENEMGRHPWQEVFRSRKDPLLPLPYNSGLSPYEPVIFNSYNTSLPRGGNDGPTWQGKGVNSTFSLGLRANAGPLVVNLRPQIGFAQNRGFDLGPHPVPRGGLASEFAYRAPRFASDYVQRFGPDSYSWANPGDSFAEIRLAGFSAGISNSRIWTGPGQISSLQFGYNAPGFLHAHVGTFRPLQTPAGSIEFKYIFGGIRKSDYFSDSETDPRLAMRQRSIHSLVFIYSPGFVSGLSFGAVRTFIQPYPDSFSEYRVQAAGLFETFSKSSLDSDPETGSGLNENQVASVFARWVLPEAGMEIYWEYGRNDHNLDLRDFRAQPDHLRAYILGMLKTVSLENNRIFATGIEVMQGETPRSSLVRGDGVLAGWYTHGGQPVGFTHRGQIIGTGYSPGSNYQMIWSDLYGRSGKIGLKIGRIVHHNGWADRYFDQIQELNSLEVERWQIRNIELLAGVHLTAFLKHGIEISAAIDHSFILNRHYIAGNDITNTRFELVFRKQLDGWLR